jgi:hypothetical protein
MVFKGKTTCPSYTTILLPNDTLVDLTHVAQANLRIKLVRPQIICRVGINGIKIIEDAQMLARIEDTYANVWRTTLESIRNNPMNENPIMNVVQQREWNINEKSRNIITSLLDIQNDVFHFQRDKLSRWYDIQHHNMNEIFIQGLTEVPHFKKLKNNYNCNLNRDKYIKLEYITGIKYYTPRSLTVSPPSILPIHASVVHNRADSRVGKKTEILADELLPSVCKPMNIIIRPDVPFNWNDKLLNTSDNLSDWLSRHGANFINVQA